MWPANEASGRRRRALPPVELVTIAWSGGRGELHPRAPTDPGVSLLAHRALVALITRPRGSTASERTCRGHGG
jgi:hypothetical protein